MKVHTRKELKPWIEEIRQLRQEVEEIKAQLPEWVSLKEACKLNGRKETWFFTHREAGTLPIRYLARDENSKRFAYSRADCVAYAKRHTVYPLPHIQLI